MQETFCRHLQTDCNKETKVTVVRDLGHYKKRVKFCQRWMRTLGVNQDSQYHFFWSRHNSMSNFASLQEFNILWNYTKLRKLKSRMWSYKNH